MRRLDRIKCRKQKSSTRHKRIYLGTKTQKLTNLKFSGRLFFSESMSHENQQIPSKCQQLKSGRKIRATCFFNNILNVKLRKHGRIYKIFHVTENENLLELDNLEEYINNAFI